MQKFVVEDPSIPTGAPYEGAFVDIEDAETDFGSKFLWKFEITKGEHAGKEATGFTGREPRVTNKCGKWLCALLGAPLVADTEVDPGACVGKKYLITMRETQGDGAGTTIDYFARLPETADTPF